MKINIFVYTSRGEKRKIIFVDSRKTLKKHIKQMNIKTGGEIKDYVSHIGGADDWIHSELPAVPRLQASPAYCLRHISSLQLTSNNKHVNKILTFLILQLEFHQFVSVGITFLAILVGKAFQT